ncbi:MAG: hypothetical protein ACR2FH_07065, partial [Caulobacteraceae bacterium]
AKQFEATGSVAGAILSSLPMPANADTATAAQILAERKAQALHVAQAAGWPAASIAKVQEQDFSDAGLKTIVASNLSAKDQLEQQDKQNTFDETHRHNVATETKPQFVETKNADGSTTQTQVNGAPGAAVAGVGDTGSPSAPLSGPVGDQMRTAAGTMNATQGETSYLNQLAMKESTGKPGATNGSSTGLFQFHPDTFAAAGGGNINDVGEQTKAALTLARRNAASLQSDLGRAPTPGELYLAHQQGIGGATALLSSPNARAIDVLTPIYARQYGGHASAVARQAVVRNGGDPNMTAGQFAQHVEQYFGGGKGASGGAAPAIAPGGAPRVISGQGGGDELLSSKTLDYYAHTIMMGEKPPPLGYGRVGAANRAALYNRVADIEEATHSTGADAVIRHIG